MNKLFEYYKTLGVAAGAGIGDITSSYKRLCRLYHPDVNDDPDSEELMKRINIAYSALREKFKREAVFRERTSSRTVRRPAASGAETAQSGMRHASDAYAQDADKRSFEVLDGYFKALSGCDYGAAYDLLSEYDKRHFTREGFARWRDSVTRLYQMRGFTIKENAAGATVTFKDGKRFYAYKYHIEVTEVNPESEREESGEVTKLVISENGVWRVFLGYKNIGEITRIFDERFEARRKSEIRKNWEEYCEGLCLEYDMLNLKGMQKAAARETYRQKRYGGALTFAAFSIKPAAGAPLGSRAGLYRSAARTLGASLRLTDISAYAGDGVFAVLFVELKKKHAAAVVCRIAEKIERQLGELPAGRSEVEYAFEAYSGLAGTDDFNRVLEKFDKKL